jgi:zinc finger HIT domain-containing protein 1
VFDAAVVYRAVRKPKSLERIIFEEIADGAEGRPNYESVAAEPPTAPPIKFCSVCGYVGNYTCTRCGQRFCSVRCNTNHKETRCLKFSM